MNMRTPEGSVVLLDEYLSRGNPLTWEAGPLHPTDRPVPTIQQPKLTWREQLRRMAQGKGFPK